MRLLRLAWADVLERTRQPGYLISLLVMVWLGHGMLPGDGAGYRTFVVSQSFRPSYGAEWVGSLSAILTSMYLLFVGFYLVRGTIERDRRFGVGAILATCRMGKLTYLASKALSHVIVLMSMATVVMLAAIVTQQIRAEDPRIDVWASAVPFLMLTLPVALFVSASAVLFDSTPVIRGGAGNVVWFALLVALIASSGPDATRAPGYRDLVGARLVAASVRETAANTYPEARSDTTMLSMGVNVNPKWREHPARRFEWRGVRWEGEPALARGFWVLISLGVMSVSVFPFDRFEHSSGSLAMRLPRMRRRDLAAPPVNAGRLVASGALPLAARAFRFHALFRAELVLMFRGQRWWWYAGALALLITGLVTPLAAVRQVVLPLASFWPVFVWSALGHREVRDEVASVVFSCARPLHRMLPATWLAGASVALVLGASGVIRLALAGEWAAVAGWFVCALLAPLLAIACGAWSGGGRLFEVLWLFAWYLGPMNRVEFADYTGVAVTRSPATWLGYAVLLVGLAALAAWGRSRQLTR